MKLFVSYAFQDKSRVQPLVDILRGGGHTVLFDEALVVNQNWQEQISREIQSADAFVFAITPRSLSNEWCQLELTLAVESDKPIIPVLLEETYLPKYLSDKRRANFIGGFSKADRVAEFLAGLQQYQPISRSETLPKPAYPQGLPARVPQDTQASMQRSAPAIRLGGETDEEDGKRRRNFMLSLLVGLITLVALVVFVIIPNWETITSSAGVQLTSTPTIRPSSTLTPIPSVTPTPAVTATPEVRAAVPGERLIIVADFAGSDSAADLDTALTDAVYEAQLRGVSARVNPLSEVVTSAERAREIAHEYGATIVVWGEASAEGVVTHYEIVVDEAEPVDPQTTVTSIAAENPDSLHVTLIDESDATYVMNLILGGLLYVDQHYAEAQPFFETAIEAMSGEPVAKQREVDLGTAYFYAGSSLRGDGSISQTPETLDAMRDSFMSALDLIEPGTPLYFMTQNQLGAVYSELAVADDAPQDNLESAVTSYTSALSFYTETSDPLGYAAIQNDLGAAYAGLAENADQPLDNLVDAASAFNEALRFRTESETPLDYAETQSNLGNVYRSLAEIGADAQANLENAIAAFTEALRLRTETVNPLEYAQTQDDLGTAYWRLAGIGVDTQANLENAVAAYTEALRFRTESVTPLNYAATQNNLGIVYRDLAQSGVDPRGNLIKAVEAYNRALRIFTESTSSLDYATTQNNLGIAYADLARAGVETEQNLARAVNAYTEALRFRTESVNPSGYAATQFNLGIVYLQQENVEEGCAAWREAESITREMGSTATADRMQDAITQNCA